MLQHVECKGMQRTNNEWVAQIIDEGSNTFTACNQAFKVDTHASAFQKVNGRIHKR